MRLPLFIFALSLQAQVMLPVFSNLNVSSAGTTPITLDTSCTGTGSAITVPCSGAMTVTAGDAIYCTGSGNNFDPVSMYISDPVNGTYDNIEQIVHPNSADAETISAVFLNSAGGSITPQLTNWESITLNFKCWAYKATRTTLGMDGGSVNQTKSQGSAATNPTSGTAAAPTNANEVVVCGMVRPSTATVTAGTGYAPSGTLTAVGSSYPVYSQYLIQTTATSTNCPMTASSSTYIDDQHAILNASNPAGYRSFTGAYGATAVAETNGASATVAILNGVTSTLLTVPNSGGWALNQGVAQTFTTAIAPTGTGKILLQGVPHTFGDAGTSIQFTSAGGLTEYLWQGKANGVGHPMWYSAFARIGSSGITTSNSCDSMTLAGGVTENNLVLQTYYNATNGIYFDLEPFESGSSVQYIPSSPLSLDTDYRWMIHLAGVNEQNHQFIVQRETGSVWSTTDTFNYPVLCTVSGAALCDATYLQTHAVASGTGSASSSSLTLTMTGVSGTIAVGNVVTGTGIAYPTTVTVVSGGTITLSQWTSGAVSGTVYFNTPMANLATATSGTASTGSTALTIVANTYGTISVGNPVGGAGITQGTRVAAITGTAVTLTQPTSAALTTGTGVTFWSASNNINFGFGRYSSCGDTATHTYSGHVYDPFNDWGAFVPN